MNGARPMKTMIRLAALLLVATASSAEASAEETVPWSTGVAVTYDGSGNIKQVGTDLYRYDVAGRLLRSDANGVRWKYTYDAYGNRKTCIVDANGSELYFRRLNVGSMITPIGPE